MRAGESRGTAAAGLSRAGTPGARVCRPRVRPTPHLLVLLLQVRIVQLQPQLGHLALQPREVHVAAGAAPAARAAHAADGVLLRRIAARALVRVLGGAHDD